MRRLRSSASVCPVAKVPLSFSGRLQDTIPVLSKMGYTGVELFLRRAEDADIPLLERLLSRHEMDVSAIGTGLATGDGLCLGSPEERIRLKSVKRVAGFSRLAERLGSWIILGSIKGLVSQRPSIRSLKRSCRELRETRSLIEAVNRYESPFINTGSEAKEFIKRNDLSGFGILLDAFHMNIEERSPADAVRDAGGMLGHFHIADSNRRAPGEGHTEFCGIFEALSRIKYRGYVSAELLQKPSSAVALRKTIAFVRTMMSQ